MNGLSEINGSPRKRLRRTDGVNNKVTVVLGAQWGDEGKGKVVDMLATDVDVVCRCQVGKHKSHGRRRLVNRIFFSTYHKK